MIKVWDPLLRLFHWSLVASIALVWLTAEDGKALHEWAGYAALGLIAFRLIWGLIGPRYARFTQFICGLQEVIGYTKDMLNKREKRYIGHNPLGAVMMVALLATIAATSGTGWLIAKPERMAFLPEMPALIAPAFASSDEGEENDGYGESGGEALKGLHEAFANLLLLLIFMHVAGVIYASRRHQENLTRAMITGQKMAPTKDDIT